MAPASPSPPGSVSRSAPRPPGSPTPSWSSRGATAARDRADQAAGLQRAHRASAPPSTRRTSRACAPGCPRRSRPSTSSSWPCPLAQRRAADRHPQAQRRGPPGRRPPGPAQPRPRSGPRWPAARRRARAGGARPARRARHRSPPPGTPRRTCAATPEARCNSRVRSSPRRQTASGVDARRVTSRGAAGWRACDPRREPVRARPGGAGRPAGGAARGLAGRYAGPRRPRRRRAGSPSCCARTSGRAGAGPAAGKEDVLVEVSDHGLRTRENVVVRDETGLIRAWGSVHDRAGGRMLFVHIVERGLPEQVGRACSDLLVEWAVGQAREVGAARGLAVQQIDTGAFADDERQHRWLAAGRVRPGAHLVADEPSGHPGRGGAGATTRCAGSGTASWSGWSSRAAAAKPDEADLREVHEVLEAAFIDHFNSKPETFDEFLFRLREDPGHRWDHWWLAEVDGRAPAGAPGRDVRSAGGPDGSYVSYIGVMEAARGRGVAKGLLRTVIADAAARGRDRVGLEVDADSPTGADRLYRGMGWETSYVTESWHRDVPVLTSTRLASGDQASDRLGTQAAARQRARSALWMPLGVSTPTNCAPSLDPDHALSSRSITASASSRVASTSIAVGEVAGADPVERLEVAAVDRGHGQPAQPLGRADEVRDEVVGRVAEQLGRGAELRQPAAGREHRDPVAHPDRLVDVVGDQHDGLAELATAAAGTRPAAGPAPPGRRRRTARPSAAPAGSRPAPGPRRPAAAGRRRAGAGSGRRTSRGPARPGRAARWPAARATGLRLAVQQRARSSRW